MRRLDLQHLSGEAEAGGGIAVREILLNTPAVMQLIAAGRSSDLSTAFPAR